MNWIRIAYTFLVLASTPVFAWADSLRAGVAQEKITPAAGGFLGGYPHVRVAQTVQSDLYAKAMVFEHGGKRVAIVANDLVGVTPEIVKAAQELIAKNCGISADAVMICATHTHTGPEIRDRKGYPYGSDPAYNAELARKMAAVVERACNALFEASLHVGRADAEGFAMHRYRRLNSGRDIECYTDPPKDTGYEKDIVGFAAPVDHTVRTLCLRDAKGRVRGLAVNFALHPNSGKKASYYSAEWPGETARCIAEKYGADVPCLVLQGAAGDVQRKPGTPQRDGKGVAEAAAKADERAVRLAGGPLDRRLAILKIPYCLKAELAKEIAFFKDKKDLSEVEKRLVQSLTKCYDRWEHDNQVMDVPVQCFRIGEAAIVGLPGEPFTALGLEIRKGSPAKETFVVGYANDWRPGYIPPADQATRGAYGERACETRRLVAEAAGQIVDAAIANLRQMWRRPEESR